MACAAFLWRGSGIQFTLRGRRAVAATRLAEHSTPDVQTHGNTRSKQDQSTLSNSRTSVGYFLQSSRKVDKLRVKPPKMTANNKMLYFSLQAQLSEVSAGFQGLGLFVAC